MVETIAGGTDTQARTLAAVSGSTKASAGQATVSPLPALVRDLSEEDDVARPDTGFFATADAEAAAGDAESAFDRLLALMAAVPDRKPEMRGQALGDIVPAPPAIAAAEHPVMVLLVQQVAGTTTQLTRAGSSSRGAAATRPCDVAIATWRHENAPDLA